MDDEYKTKMFIQNQELDSWTIDEALSGGYYDSSSPDGGPSSSLTASKNIVSERNRRKKLNERLFALRSVVPKISKMDKASIIKDAIDYIQELQQQERILEAEIKQLESTKFKKSSSSSPSTSTPAPLKSKRKKLELSTKHSPIEVVEHRVADMGEKIVLVSLTCIKRGDTMVQLCEVFESLNLKVITANITTISDNLINTFFIQADEADKDELKLKIETAIAALSNSQTPMNTRESLSE